MTLHLGEKFRKAATERAEAMPAVIISAIVSALLMITVAGIISLIMQNSSNTSDRISMTTTTANIDSSMKADITSATYVTASVRLKQPTGGGLLNANDLLISGVNLHIPSDQGTCKLVRWSIIHGTLTRNLTIYNSTVTNNSLVQCDTTSTVLGQRSKVFAQNVTLDSDNYQVLNQAGRTVVFTITEPTLDNINNQLQSEYTANNTNQLPDSQFDQLNSMLTTSSIAPAYSNPNACVMNQPKNSSGTCPVQEADPLKAAWNSMVIAKVVVAFHLTDSHGANFPLDIEQNVSTSLYSPHTAVGEPQQ